MFRSTDYHIISLDELKKSFCVNLDTGMSKNKARELLALNGPNNLPEQSFSSLYLFVLKNLINNFSCLIWLTFALSCISYKLDPLYANFYLIICILIIVIISVQVFLTGLQTLWSIRSTRNMRKDWMILNKSIVMRDGATIRVDSSELVVGDVVMLSTNQRVPADLRLIEVRDLKIDKSTLTGESEPVRATVSSQYNIDNKIKYIDATNIAFAGTTCVYGSGKGVVVATGKKMLINNSNQLFNLQFVNIKSSDKTFCQKVFNKFGFMILSFACILTLVFVIIWLSWLRNWLIAQDMALNIFAIIIAMVPLPMPIAFFIAFLLVIRQLRKYKIIVKGLGVIDYLSSSDVFVIDKTGTLTQNKAHVASIVYGYEEIGVEKDASAMDQLIACGYLCNNYRLYLFCNSMDAALQQLAEKKGVNNLDSLFVSIREIDFKSRNRFQCKVVKPRDLAIYNAGEKVFGKLTAKDCILLVKGAPDVLRQKSKFVLDNVRIFNNGEGLLDEEIRNKMDDIQNEWSCMGKRVLMLCKKKLKEAELNHIKDFEKYFKTDCNDLTIIGMVGLIDPPREGVVESIQNLRRAGIRTVMVTGDYKLTAASMAVQVGILSDLSQSDNLTKMRELKTNIEYNPAYSQGQTGNNKFSGSLLLSSPHIELLTKEEWKFICNHYKEIVLSRTTPDQKLRCVKEFQQSGYIVTMVGDGVNDIQALRNAHIGVAMGSGNKLSLEAADLILPNNSFSFLVESIKCCRLGCENMRKLLLYFLSASVFVDVVYSLVSKIIGSAKFLSHSMTLFVMLTDFIASLSIIFEKPEKNMLDKGPRKSTNYLVDMRLVIHGFLFLGCFILLGSIISMEIFMGFYYLPNTTNSTPLSNPLFVIHDSPSNCTYPRCDFSKLHSYTSEYKVLLDQVRTIALVTVVFMQLFGTLQIIRLRYLSVVEGFPFSKNYQNYKIFLVIFIDLTMTMAVIHIPALSRIFKTRPLPWIFYILPVGYSLIMIAIDELRKLAVRKNLISKKFSW